MSEHQRKQHLPAGLPAVAALTALMADRGNCADWFPGGTIAELCF